MHLVQKIPLRDFIQPHLQRIGIEHPIGLEILRARVHFFLLAQRLKARFRG